MENFLNYCWLLLALAALSAWLGLASRRRRTSLGLIALLCVLTLMFPVISATDDLHPVAQAIEDSSRRTQKALIAINQFVTHINYGIAPCTDCCHTTSLSADHRPAIPVGVRFGLATRL